MSFPILMWSPFDSGGCIGEQGGPGLGGHQGPKWYIRYGMDLKARAGTPVYAAFDGYVTKPTVEGHSAHEYGNQIFVRSHNHMMGCFYTHIKGPKFPQNHIFTMGDPLGVVMIDHLHMAIVEIIGGWPSNDYKGVNIFKPSFLDMCLRNGYLNVTFYQNHSPPFAAPA
jgi:hypothetical protein